MINTAREIEYDTCDDFSAIIMGTNHTYGKIKDTYTVLVNVLFR